MTRHQLNGTPRARDRDIADEVDDRAVQHAAAALEALHDDDRLGAIALALLALEARVEELTVHIARR
jgi:hypothetical protein